MVAPSRRALDSAMDFARSETNWFFEYGFVPARYSHSYLATHGVNPGRLSCRTDGRLPPGRGRELLDAVVVRVHDVQVPLTVRGDAVFQNSG